MEQTGRISGRENQVDRRTKGVRSGQLMLMGEVVCAHREEQEALLAEGTARAEV